MSEGPRRILAIDFGDRRTGLAATDYTGAIILPLDPIVGLDDAGCAREIAALCDDRDTEVVVVGLPLDKRGEIGPRAKRTQKFVEALKKATDRPIEFVDETSTTDEAHARLKEFGLKASKRKKAADSVAAMIILERFRYSV